MAKNKEKLFSSPDNLSDYIHAQCEGENCVGHSVRDFVNTGKREGWKKYHKDWDSPKIKVSTKTAINPHYAKKKK